MIKTFLIYTIFDYCMDKLETVINENLTKPELLNRIRLLTNSITAGTRTLKAHYTLEVAQDLTIIDLLDMEAQLKEMLMHELNI